MTDTFRRDLIIAGALGAAALGIDAAAARLRLLRKRHLRLTCLGR